MRAICSVVAVLALTSVVCAQGVRPGYARTGKPDLGVVDEGGGRPVLGIVEVGNYAYTDFEDINGDGTDASGFFVGDVKFTGGAAGTRQFPPGYNVGEYAWITAVGTSLLDVQSDRPNNIQLWAKDIAELNDILGVQVDGYLYVRYQNGVVEEIEVPEKWTRYAFRNVASIMVDTNGVTNLDNFGYIGK